MAARVEITHHARPYAILDGTQQMGPDANTGACRWDPLRERWEPKILM
jgi:hypothetical protein